MRCFIYDSSYTGSGGPLTSHPRKFAHAMCRWRLLLSLKLEQSLFLEHWKPAIGRSWSLMICPLRVNGPSLRLRQICRINRGAAGSWVWMRWGIRWEPCLSGYLSAICLQCGPSEVGILRWWGSPRRSSLKTVYSSCPLTPFLYEPWAASPSPICSYWWDFFWNPRRICVGFLLWDLCSSRNSLLIKMPTHCCSG